MDIEIKAGVLTVSDKGSMGQRRDESGEIIVGILEKQGFEILKREIVADVRRRIADKLRRWVDRDKLSLIVTSGGTGISPTDLTPQATADVIEYEVPGMAEAMRSASLKKTPHAMISRAKVGVRGGCLIINLPGSPGGAKDNLSVLLPALEHALLKLSGDTTDCAQPLSS
jgi:molybdenum cofactor synthesis domain-containing protein